MIHLLFILLDEMLIVNFRHMAQSLIIVCAIYEFIQFSVFFRGLIDKFVKFVI